MFNKFVLILIMALLLLGAAVASTPIPVLWGMACMIFIALSVGMPSEQQG